jgi:uncharacterized protein
VSSPLTSLRLDADRAQVPVTQASLIWLGAWMIGQLCAAAVAAASGHTTVSTAGPGWLFGVALAGWVPLLFAMGGAGRKWGSGSFVTDWGLSFKPVDLWGAPIGVITQLVLVPLLYWPLHALWPDAFTTEKLQERAQDLYDSASGAGVALLVLQGAFTRRLHDWVGVTVVALWFAVIHFQPVETPGLFVVGMVLGSCALLTGRLGMGVVAHVAFNATGLVLVAMA